MYEKFLYSQEIQAREIEGKEFVEDKYLLDPQDPKAFHSLEEIEQYKELVAQEAIQSLMKED